MQYAKENNVNLYLTLTKITNILNHKTTNAKCQYRSYTTMTVRLCHYNSQCNTVTLNILLCNTATFYVTITLENMSLSQVYLHTLLYTGKVGQNWF